MPEQSTELMRTALYAAHLAHGLEDPRDPDAGELGGQCRLNPGDGDERHRRQVVDLVGLGRTKCVHQRTLVEQVSLVKGDAVAQVLDPVELLGGGAPHQPVDGVALLQEQFGQVGAVLPGDPCNKCRGDGGGA